MLKFIKKFKDLSKPSKSMVYLMWIYRIGSIVSSVFINIYVFKFQKNLLDVVFYNGFFLTFCLLGFSGLGLFMAALKRDIRFMYYIAYFLFILAFVIIFLIGGYLGIFLFAILYGLGNGIFRCAVHTQELSNIKDKSRDLYSSIVVSGDNIFKIIVPFFISILFYFIGKFFDFSPYIVLFLLLPFVYVFSFLFIKNLSLYIPREVNYKDFKNFFSFKKNRFGFLYFLFGGLYYSPFNILFPIVSIILLKTEVNVGIYEGAFYILSTIIIILFSSIRKKDNRLSIMFYTSILIFINLIIFIFNFNFIGYIIYSMISLVLNPMFRVSEQVFDMKLMDTIRASGSDFYPAMIFRELCLWIGRMISIIILIIFITLGYDVDVIIRIGLFFTGLFIFMTSISVFLHFKFDDKNN
ncbi:MAG: hypothetical protein PHN31_04310 [Candidatus Gracilibacteria bacterium]|nr:hypothetical protein [Candidatus Gracilibacteria bacterium]